MPGANGSQPLTVVVPPEMTTPAETYQKVCLSLHSMTVLCVLAMYIRVAHVLVDLLSHGLGHPDHPVRQHCRATNSGYGRRS